MYNLRSSKHSTVQLPIEIQLAGDTQFINSLLNSNPQILDTQGNMSDTDTSASDLNCSDLMQNSFDSVTNVKGCSNGPTTSKSDVSSLKDSDSDVQAAINAQILDQLNHIGKRLDKIENNDCKKTLDKTKIKTVKNKHKKSEKLSDSTEQQQSLPVTHNVWQSSVSDEALLQLKVDQRLQELTDLAKSSTTSKIKSQRGGNFEVLVKQRVKWPHEYVLSGLNKERVTYDQLNVTQWLAGFGQTMRDESDPIMKQHMLEYLITLMDDANDFSWTSAKASHAVLLCRMEQGEIKDFSDTASIDQVRRANAQKHVPIGALRIILLQIRERLRSQGQCPVLITIRELAFNKKPMRQGGSYINISVLHVLQILAELFHMLRQNAKIKINRMQKMNNFGWVHI